MYLTQVIIVWGIAGWILSLIFMKMWLDRATIRRSELKLLRAVKEVVDAWDADAEADVMEELLIPLRAEISDDGK